MQQFEDLKIDNLYHDDIPIIINNDRRPSQSSTSTWTTYQHQRNRLKIDEIRSKARVIGKIERVKACQTFTCE